MSHVTRSRPPTKCTPWRSRDARLGSSAGTRTTERPRLLGQFPTIWVKPTPCRALIILPVFGRASSTSLLAGVKLHERQAAQARAEDEAFQGYVQGSPPTVIGASDSAELPGKVGCTAGKGVLSDEEFANQKAMMLA